MLILKKISEVRDWVRRKSSKGGQIGLVPTMGYLHEGHLSLARAARRENDFVIMSIFVNPLQFGANEDLDTYPRDLKRDSQLAAAAGVDAIFAPEVSEMYPYYPQLTTVNVTEITEVLCGAVRPGHFSGVATVVTKLFNIVQPDRAYFGQKDYQQCLVIKRMVADLNMPVEIKMVPIVREKDGLAMSSRNVYLSEEERRQALCLYEALRICRELYDKGERSARELLDAVQDRIRQEPLAAIDYAEICSAELLQEVDEIKENVVVALAVRIGSTRLIDNIVLEGDTGV